MTPAREWGGHVAEPQMMQHEATIPCVFEDRMVWAERVPPPSRGSGSTLTCVVTEFTKVSGLTQQVMRCMTFLDIPSCSPQQYIPRDEVAAKFTAVTSPNFQASYLVLVAWYGIRCSRSYMLLGAEIVAGGL